MLAFGGVVGDRVPRRVVMVGSDVASAFVRTAMGALLISGHAEVWHLIALQACGGAAVAFYSPASYGLTREVVPEDELQQANGLLAIARYAAFPLGGAIGGSIVVLVGTGAALLVDAGTYATSALLLSRIDVVSIAKAGAGFLRELREGWSAFVEQTWVWVLVLWISFYFLITYAPFFVLGPYVAKHSMDGARSWTFVVVGEGVGALLGGIAGLRWRPRRPMVTAGFLLMVTAVQNLILAFHPETVLLTIAAARLRLRIRARLGDLGHDAATVDPAGEARARRVVWLDGRDGLPPRRVCAGGAGLDGDRDQDDPRARRLLGRREHALRRPAPRRARGRVRRRDRRSAGGCSVGSALVPPVPVPPEVDAFLARPNPAVVATVSPTGEPHTAATWYDWEDGRVLLNMDEGRLRLRYMRQNPAVALTVLGEDSWYAQITLLGRVVSIEDDPDLAGIDRLSIRYYGKPFHSRDARRVTAWMEPHRWSSWPLPR